MKYVLINKLCADTGYSPNAVRAKIKRGIWRDGVHFIKRQGRVHFNLKAIEAWVEGKVR